MSNSMLSKKMTKRGPRTKARAGRGESKRTVALHTGGSMVAPFRLSTTPFSVIGGFPDKSRVRLAWALLANVAVTTTTISRLTISLSSLFDPGQSVSAEQPANFDIWAVLYEYYRVHSATVTVRIAMDTYTATDGTAGVQRQKASSAIRVGFCPFNVSSTALSPRNVWTNPRSRLFDLVPAKPLSFKGTYDIATILGLTNQQLTCSESTNALVTADPAEQAFIDLCYTNSDTTLTQALTVDIQVVFDAEFYDRVPVDVDIAERLAALRQARNQRKGPDFVPTLGTAPAPPERVELKQGFALAEAEKTAQQTEQKGPAKAEASGGLKPVTDLDEADEGLFKALHNLKSAKAAARAKGLSLAP